MLNLLFRARNLEYYCARCCIWLSVSRYAITFPRTKFQFLRPYAEPYKAFKILSSNPTMPIRPCSTNVMPEAHVLSLQKGLRFIGLEVWGLRFRVLGFGI